MADDKDDKDSGGGVMESVKKRAQRDYETVKNYISPRDKRAKEESDRSKAKERNDKYQQTTGARIGVGSQTEAVDSYRKGGVTRKKKARLHRGEYAFKRKKKGRSSGRS